MSEWDDTTDVLVAGSGAGGVTGAYTAAREGMSVILVEASDRFGGTTAYSGGGGMWFPGNPVVRRAGVEDDVDEAVQYYAAVADGALRGVRDRPMILKRFVKGIGQEAIFQKRAPANRPDFVSVAELKYASGTSAKEAVLHDAAGLIWAVNLGCVDLNPHPVRADDLDHPDELRVDLDPMPGVGWRQILDVAFVAREVLEDHGLVAWPKTSGSRGFHIYTAIQPRWPFKLVLRCFA